MDRMDVLLVVVDQWRGDVLPCRGAGFLNLPNIERLCRPKKSRCATEFVD